MSTGGSSSLDIDFAVITVLTGQHLLVYASVIDNATNDPITIPARK